MLGYFPLAKDDEEASSLFARAYDHFGRPGQRAVLGELFGPANTIASVEFPCGLLHLVKALPPNHPLTLDTLFSGHTRVPYYAPFLSKARVESLRVGMAGSGAQGMLRRTGLATNRPNATEFFRHCPGCDAEDHEVEAERYWHRLYQLPGVQVCYKHETWLENSGARTRNRRNRLQYVSAERSISIGEARPINAHSQSKNALIQIARDSAWLLAKGLTCGHIDFVSAQYTVLLRDRGYTSYRGKLLSAERLVSQFTSYYGAGLLSQLGCLSSTTAEHSWLVRLVRRNEDRVQHPLHHLLMIQWLGLTAQEFFAAAHIPAESPFGTGPWHCRNPVCPQRGSPSIIECTITYSDQTGGPVGRCACPVCGYTYRLTGSSRDGLDPRAAARADQVVEYGPLWEAALVSVCTDAEIPAKRKASLLGLDYQTLCHMAGVRGLDIVGPRRVAQTVRDASSLAAPGEGPHQGRCSVHREAWAKLVYENGSEGVKALRQRTQATYSWLYRWDREWLKTHSTKHQREPKDFSCRVDWHGRDVELVVRVKEAAVFIEMLPTPTRVTLHALSCQLDLEGKLTAWLARLPLTSRAVSEVRETAAEFAIRRLWWVVARYQELGVVPTRAKLAKRAGLQRQLRDSVVIASLEDAVAYLGNDQEGTLGTPTYKAA